MVQKVSTMKKTQIDEYGLEAILNLKLSEAKYTANKVKSGTCLSVVIKQGTSTVER